tara:strand:+ start:294 stop:749 length:456 start_codon:yes stop_codon:yes gene_type:complete
LRIFKVTINENINRLTLKEVLDLVAAAKTAKEKAVVLKHYDTKHLRYFLKGAFDDSIEWIVPKGTPPYKPNTHRDCDHVRRHIIKRFKFFVKGGPYITDMKREVMFIRLLENVDPDDAELLILCKDKEMAGVFKGLTKKLISESFPGLIKK